MINKPLSEKRTPLTYCLYALAMLIPCAYLLMWYVIQGHSFLSAKPYFSDELGYWRLMYSFDNCGFGFGPCECFVGCDPVITPFGSHGLSPILAWGWYALLFPWRENSIFVANFVMLTASIGIFMLLLKPNAKNTLLLIVLMFFYAPDMLYINTAMMEIPCVTAIIVYSALYIRWRKTKEKIVFGAAIAIGIYLGILRICYVIVLLPLLWERWRFEYSFKTILKLAAVAAACLILYKVTSLFIADFPNSFTTVISAMPFHTMLRVLISHFLHNVVLYLHGCMIISAEGSFRRMYMATLLYFLYKSIAKGEEKRLYLGLLVTNAAVLVAAFLLYDIGDWRDYRSMMPMLLFAMLFIATDNEISMLIKTTMLTLTVVLFCISINSDSEVFVHEERFTETQDNKAAFAEVFGEEIASVSTMCEDGVFDRLKDIPPQIGIKWMTDEGGVITSDTEFIMIGGDDREVSSDYEFVGKPADKCYVYRKVN